MIIYIYMYMYIYIYTYNVYIYRGATKKCTAWGRMGSVNQQGGDEHSLLPKASPDTEHMEHFGSPHPTWNYWSLGGIADGSSCWITVGSLELLIKP